ncbi:MAG TPA: arsenic resistance N-acetyltransferase ArsN2 [Gammaproteobacteria bacterium]|nr:arsenic resistance N-acetyltransferase ArsN2 [Gammaproteobacteria bacterium]
MPAGPIVRLRQEQLPQLEALLAANALPASDCAEQSENFYGIFDRDRLVAAGGLQPAGEYFLLRSLVVDPACRGRGLARLLSEFLLDRAEAEAGIAVYLLTESALEYFIRLGFETAEREQVPEAVSRTRQFASLCPDEARCLMFRLPRN